MNIALSNFWFSNLFKFRTFQLFLNVYFIYFIFFFFLFGFFLRFFCAKIGGKYLLVEKLKMELLFFLF